VTTEAINRLGYGMTSAAVVTFLVAATPGERAAVLLPVFLVVCALAVGESFGGTQR
jgi:hypothetical protein